MNYVMSDLHGCHDKFVEMLKLINFSEEDNLYIVGDVVDRGKASIKLLQELMSRSNIRLMMGNHDYIMAKVLNALPLDITIDGLKKRLKEDSDDLLTDYRFWMDNGGDSTLREYLDISLDERADILKFLNRLACYHELSIENQKYMLVHSIPRGFDKDKPMEDYNPVDLLFYRIRNNGWDEDFFDNKILIVGHTPTFYINKNYSGKIYKRRRVINIDCGCVYEGYGGKLCCLRLDDMKEYYV